jgi:hypothetical protein
LAFSLKQDGFLFQQFNFKGNIMIDSKITSIKGFDRNFFARYEAVGGREIVEKSLFSALNKLLDRGINLAELLNNQKIRTAQKKAA